MEENTKQGSGAAYEYDMLEHEKKDNALQVTKDEMESFILDWEDDLAEADEETKHLYALFVNLLTADNDPVGLHAKAYGSYGGNGVFPEDWKESARCLKALLKFPGYEYAAGALGYIYYYGRITGKPDYKKAFRYFTRAAAAGDWESMYKISDMYRQGLYVPQDRDLAFQIVQQVYGETKARFLDGDDGCPFADAALRMGYFYQEEDPYRAAAYFMEAEYALRRRMKVSSFWGDKKVYANIRSALRETGLRLEETREKRREDTPAVFARFLADTAYDRYELKVKPMGKEVRLTLKRLPRPGKEKAAATLMSIPAIQWTAKTTTLTLYAFGAGKKVEKGTFPVDSMDIKGEKTTFFFAGKPVYTLTAKGWEIRNTERKKAGAPQKVYTFASVAFETGGATYDYLCDLPDIQAGDKVVVPGYNGVARTVTVVDVFQSTVEDMPLPFERYKKVLGKG